MNKVCGISMHFRKPEVSPRDVLFLEIQMSLAQSPAPRTGATSSPVLAGTSGAGVVVAPASPACQFLSSCCSGTHAQFSLTAPTLPLQAPHSLHIWVYSSFFLEFIKSAPSPHSALCAPRLNSLTHFAEQYLSPSVLLSKTTLYQRSLMPSAK